MKFRKTIQSFAPKGLCLSWGMKGGDLSAETIHVGPEQMQEYTLQREASGTIVEIWKGHSLCGRNFTVTTRWTSVDGGVEGTIEFCGNESKLFVEEIEFPVVSLAFPKVDFRLLVGVTQGWTFRFTPSAPEGLLAENPYAAFQFTSLFSEKELGVYIDHRDSRYNIKTCHWERRGDTLLYIGRHPLPCAPRNRKAGGLRFPSRVCRFKGGWYEAAQLYRPWALSTPHFRNCPPPAKNPMREIALWVWNRGDIQSVIPPVKKLAKDANVPVAMDWYWWHHNPYDTDYPDYWPPREGTKKFRQAIGELRKSGVFPQVYVNGLAWDLEAPSYPDGGAESMVVSRDGKPYAVEFNHYTKRKLGYACGEAPLFQQKIRTIVKHLVECGVKGVYLDMIGCASNHACYNPVHHHAPGGGNYGMRGYRRFLKELRQRFPDICFSTENCNEAYLDAFDSVILLASSMERCGCQENDDVVPVYSAVYHGATAMFGSYALPDGIPPWDPLWPPKERWIHEKKWDEVFPDQFYVEMARTFVWGMQPMVCNFLMKHTEGRFAPLYSFVIEMARIYYNNRQFLFDGRMLPPPKLECAMHQVEFLHRMIFTTEEKHTVMKRELPAVLHSAWEAPDGERAVFMVNVTSQKQDCLLDGKKIQLKPRGIEVVRLN